MGWAFMQPWCFSPHASREEPTERVLDAYSGQNAGEMRSGRARVQPAQQERDILPFLPPFPGPAGRSTGLVEAALRVVPRQLRTMDLM